jgi:hypothetical protein
MGRKCVFELFSKSKTYVTFLEDAEYFRYPSVCRAVQNVYQVNEHNLKNRRLTICVVSDMLGISFESVPSILQYVLGPPKVS